MAPVSFVVDRVSEFDINGISLKEGIQKSGFSRKDWFENIVKTERKQADSSPVPCPKHTRNPC